MGENKKYGKFGTYFLIWIWNDTCENWTNLEKKLNSTTS